PHVLEWWDQPGPTPDEVERKYSPRVLREANVSAYIILRNREPIGYVQTYPVEDGTWGLRITTIAIGVDIFVGKPDLLHRGLGPRLLRRFLNDVAFSTSAVVQCFADPVCRNTAGVRAFAKAGFRHITTVVSPETQALVCVMSVTRSDCG
ncbi:MAG: GNAT family N-acetyltransferase, partial [Bacillati bacterium ANGP1]